MLTRLPLQQRFMVFVAGGLGSLLPERHRRHLALQRGSHVAVIGGGPAGPLFSYFLLDLAARAELDLRVDIFEPRDFTACGPRSCGLCGGVISESLMQMLAADGIVLPPTVVQRGLDSYVLHTDVGSVQISTPLHEKRIGAVYRGSGPRGTSTVEWDNFDGHLLNMAVSRGAHVIQDRVHDVRWSEGRPQVAIQPNAPQTYDLLAVAVGVNTSALHLFERIGIGYRAPRTTRTHISEFYLGREAVERYLGSAMHIFLPNLPRLEFAALIPKGAYATLCLLGREIDEPLVRSFLQTPEVRACLPPGWQRPTQFCHCAPRINIRGVHQPFGDRIVFIGDCGVTRLYKDGIGAAYRTARAAAETAINEGIGVDDFRRRYWPVCRAIEADNWVGKAIFALTRRVQRRRALRLAVLRMAAREAARGNGRGRMSTVLWDVFTGSAPYRTVFLRILHPTLLGQLLRQMVTGLMPREGELPDPSEGATP